MQRRPLGATGILVSQLGLGAGPLGDASLDEADAARLLHGALDLGVTLIDAARSYGLAEERIGRHLERRRDDVVISTKVGYGIDGVPDWTHACVEAGVDRALRVMRTDRLDVVHLHSCPLDVLSRGEILDALERARHAGKIRVAAYSGDNEALRFAVDCGRFGSVQASWSAVDRALAPLLPVTRERGVGVLAKRALANGAFRELAPPPQPDRRVYWDRWRALSLPSPIARGTPAWRLRRCSFASPRSRRAWTRASWAAARSRTSPSWCAGSMRAHSRPTCAPSSTLPTRPSAPTGAG
jgi:aryl-alcohol dehydrogenase-like predicted oxidoreductase